MQPEVESVVQETVYLAPDILIHHVASLRELLQGSLANTEQVRHSVGVGPAGIGAFSFPELDEKHQLVDGHVGTALRGDTIHLLPELGSVNLVGVDVIGKSFAHCVPFRSVNGIHTRM